jgi:hypothetical protein
MKSFERILLYSVLAVLVFYVFLEDGNVESKLAIQEEIRAKSISIMNNAGQEVVSLCTIEDGGAIFVAFMGAPEDDGIIGVLNKHGKVIDTLP